MTTEPRTRTRHEHWCSSAPRKNRDQVAPDAQCVEQASPIPCRTTTITAVRERSFRDGRVRVTWDNGSSSWEQAR